MMRVEGSFIHGIEIAARQKLPHAAFLKRSAEVIHTRSPPPPLRCTRCSPHGKSMSVLFDAVLSLHGSVWTSTESTGGRSRTIGAQLSPASAEAYTCPPVVPKYTPHLSSESTAIASRNTFT